MKLLIIKQNPNLTEEERKILRKDLLDAIRAGIILENPEVITHEVVEFDSIAFDNPPLYPKKVSRRDLMAKHRGRMSERIQKSKGEKPNDNSGNDEKDS